MAKYGISDEDMPHYLVFRDPQHPETPTIELSADEWADYQRVLAELRAWQRRIQAAYKSKS